MASPQLRRTAHKLHTHAVLRPGWIDGVRRAECPRLLAADQAAEQVSHLIGGAPWFGVSDNETWLSPVCMPSRTVRSIQ